MKAESPSMSGRRWPIGGFVLLQIAVMLLAISNESLWIDEFWTAYFGALGSFKAFYELLLVPSGSQTPLHFAHFYLWGGLSPGNEFLFRLANLPLFVLGQLAVFWALRDYPRAFAVLFLALSALHPMVWAYANEARPYIMMVAGSQMIMAYLLHLHITGARGQPVRPGFLLLFVLGAVLLFGASLLGVFWVFAASVFVLVHHVRQQTWRELLRGANPWWLALLLIATTMLTIYYLASLLKGAGASRLLSSTPASAAFAAYEMLGLAGIGPSRLELRSLGPTALVPYAPALLAACAALLMVTVVGLKAAKARLGLRTWLFMGALGLLPVVVVITSGFVMHWRVLGRHLIAALPLLNLVWALGLASLLQTDVRVAQGHRDRKRQIWRVVLAVSVVLLLVFSSLSLRFADRHSKDDYKTAATLAGEAHAQGQRVWWAADVMGASYYGLPGEFDVMGELTSVHKPPVCHDLPGVHPVVNAALSCLASLSAPDLVILSKPETFDTQGGIRRYLNEHSFALVQTLPAFTIWRRADMPDAQKR